MKCLDWLPVTTGLKPTTEPLIKAFIRSRSWAENSPTLRWHFVVLLVLYFLWFVSNHVSVLPCFIDGTRESRGPNSAKKKTQDNCSAGGELGKFINEEIGVLCLREWKENT